MREKKLVQRLLAKNRKLAEAFRGFETSAAAQLATVFSALERGKSRRVLMWVSRMELDEAGRILNTRANQDLVFKLLRDVGGFTNKSLAKGSPFGKWVSGTFERAGVLGVRKALDTVRIANKAALPRKSYRAASAMRLAAKTADNAMMLISHREQMNLDALRQVFLRNILDPNGSADTLRRSLVDTGQIDAMIDSAGRRVTASERADRIAHYEPQTVARQAHDEALKDFYYGGDMPPPSEMFYLWDAVGDNRTSESHARRDEKILSAKEWDEHDWGDGQHGRPPTRPRCRCDAIFLDPAWFDEQTQKRNFTDKVRATPLETQAAREAA